MATRQEQAKLVRRALDLASRGVERAVIAEQLERSTSWVSWALARGAKPDPLIRPRKTLRILAGIRQGQADGTIARSTGTPIADVREVREIAEELNLGARPRTPGQ